jgi:hypothetical protein
MKRVRHTARTILMTTLVIGCMALALMWPQWRDEVRAQISAGPSCNCNCSILSVAICTTSNCADYNGGMLNEGTDGQCRLSGCRKGANSSCPAG